MELRVNVQRFRLKKELPKEKEESALFGKLYKNIALASRGKRNYTPARSELLARVGSFPSDGGARSPLAAIITHTAGSSEPIYLD